MIVMLNGAFGAGKTTLAKALFERFPNWLLFDPEEVGFMLWRIGPEPQGDFQDLLAWAPLVVRTAETLIEVHRRPLVVPIAIVNDRNFQIIRDGFASLSPTRHFTIELSPERIADRLTQRGDTPGGWSFGQIDRCASALRDPKFGVHLDGELPTERLADQIIECLSVIE